MYESFFGLKTRPFVTVPSPETYFPASSSERARQGVIRLVQRGAGPAIVVGSVGTGKTLLCSLLAKQLRVRHRVVQLASTRISTRRGFLQAILFELGLPYRGMDEGELRLAFSSHVSSPDLCPHGLALLVDEADRLPRVVFEELRMTTNLVTNSAPCVRPVLFGGPHLDEIFADPKLESFNQRLSGRFYLEPFTYRETLEYIKARIEATGSLVEEVLTDDACDAVHKASYGVPRLINQVCEHALMLGFVCQHRQLSAADIQEAWSDLQQLPTALPTQPTQSTVIEFGSLDDSESESGEEIESETFPTLTPPAFPTVSPEAQLGAIAEQLVRLGAEYHSWDTGLSESTTLAPVAEPSPAAVRSTLDITQAMATAVPASVVSQPTVIPPAAKAPVATAAPTAAPASVPSQSAWDASLANSTYIASPPVATQVASSVTELPATVGDVMLAAAYITDINLNATLPITSTLPATVAPPATPAPTQRATQSATQPAGPTTTTSTVNATAVAWPAAPTAVKAEPTVATPSSRSSTAAIASPTVPAQSHVATIAATSATINLSAIAEGVSAAVVANSLDVERPRESAPVRQPSPEEQPAATKPETPTLSLYTAPAADPFAEEFDQEEVVLDRYATPAVLLPPSRRRVRSAESSELARQLSALKAAAGSIPLMSTGGVSISSASSAAVGPRLSVTYGAPHDDVDELPETDQAPTWSAETEVAAEVTGSSVPTYHPAAAFESAVTNVAPPDEDPVDEYRLAEYRPEEYRTEPFVQPEFMQPDFIQPDFIQPDFIQPELSVTAEEAQALAEADQLWGLGPSSSSVPRSGATSSSPLANASSANALTADVDGTVPFASPQEALRRSLAATQAVSSLAKAKPVQDAIGDVRSPASSADSSTTKPLKWLFSGLKARSLR